MKANSITYKKIFIMAMLIVFSAAAASAATTGTLTLQGSVPEILEISVNADPNASDLDLTIDASNVKVATVVEKSNKTAGYTVTLESQNAAAANVDTGLLALDSTDVDYSLSYEITYGGNAVTLSNGSAVISDVSTKTAGTGNANDVAISYNGASEFPYEGSYSDTLTFTIAAK